MPPPTAHRTLLPLQPSDSSKCPSSSADYTKQPLLDTAPLRSESTDVNAVELSHRKRALAGERLLQQQQQQSQPQKHGKRASLTTAVAGAGTNIPLLMSLSTLIIILVMVVAARATPSPHVCARDENEEPPRLKRDPLRPRIHYLPPQGGWMNDPNGPFADADGVFHLFFQYNPHSAKWGDIHWGHATSPNLAHWTTQSIALDPQVGTNDAGGVWSGSALWTIPPKAFCDKQQAPARDGWFACSTSSRQLTTPIPLLFYTGVVPGKVGEYPWVQTQSIALPAASAGNNPLWRDWLAYGKGQQSPQWNPVLRDPPAAVAHTLLQGMRDPFVGEGHVPGPIQRQAIGRARGNDAAAGTVRDQLYFMVTGAGVRGSGGSVLLFNSSDLLHWSYEHPLFEAPSGENERWTIWECPDLFALRVPSKGGGYEDELRYVLIIAANDGEPGLTQYFIGSYDNVARRFYADGPARVLDHGIYYAAKSLHHSSLKSDSVQETRTLFAWVWEERSELEQERAGWAGVQALPRQLSLVEEDSGDSDRTFRLGLRVVPEVTASLRSHLLFSAERVSEPGVFPRKAYGVQLDIVTMVSFSSSARRGAICGLAVLASPTSGEQTLVTVQLGDYDVFIVCINRTLSSLNENTTRTLLCSPSFKVDRVTVTAVPLRIIVDASILEVFAGVEGEAVITARAYPEAGDADGVGAAMNDMDHGAVMLLGTKIWKLQ